MCTVLCVSVIEMTCSLPDNDDLIARTTIVGIVLAFCKLTLDALHNVSWLLIVHEIFQKKIIRQFQRFCLQIVCYMYVIEPECLLLQIVDELKRFPSNNCCSSNI